MPTLSYHHQRFGWWCLFVFLTMGALLETLHGFKAPWYLDPSFEIRRLTWRLAHAHGTLFGLIHIAFGLTLARKDGDPGRACHLASRCLMAGTILVPGGFFLGGLWPFEGDPGLGIFLVPPGALLMLIGVLLAARLFREPPRPRAKPSDPNP